jgi:uncharacterized protein YggE
MSLRHLFSYGAVATILAVAIPANAQVMAPRVPMPPPAAADPHGITVSGVSSVSAPATSARVSLYLATRNGAMSLNAKSVQPIVDAMVKAGVDRNSIILPLNFLTDGGSNGATITGEVPHPTVAQLQSGVVTVGTAVNSVSGVVLNNANVQLTVSNCQPLLDRARSGAIARARAKADEIAKQLSVKVGSVIAVNANGEMPLTPDGSCTGNMNFGPFGSPMFQETGDYLNVTVSSAVTITYAIR